MRPRFSNSDRAAAALRRDAAFTMVEIALCLAIVGFALVAIVGVLPAGLNVQKANREETIINQDASVWLDALRSGGSPNASGYDELTKYVDTISVTQSFYDTNGTLTGTNLIRGGLGGFPLTSGAQIVGLLSTPHSYYNPGGHVENTVVAYVRAFSGSAVEKPPQDNADVRDLAFSYRLVSEVDSRSARFVNDVRLLFRWPLKRAPNATIPEPEIGNRRLVFRTQLSGVTTLHTNLPGVLGTPFFFIHSGEYR